MTRVPCDASELEYFRNIIGKEEMGLIFKESAVINGKDWKEEYVVVDTILTAKKSS